MHHVYWIHAHDHSDIATEGYVGISNQPFKRLRAHTTDLALVGSGVVRAYVEEHGIHSINHKLVAEYPSLDEARKAEEALRPTANIGWNLKKGGGVSPDCTGRMHSPETKEKISQSNIRTKGSREYVSPFKGVTGRYSAETLSKIGAAQKGKTISESHRKAASEKLSGAKSPRAKKVALQDVTNPTDVRQFDCLGDAATALGINYSTLRAACQRGNVAAKRWKQVEVPE